MKRFILITATLILLLVTGFFSFETTNHANASNFLKMPEARLCFGGQRYYTDCTGWGAGCNPHSCDEGNHQ